MAKIGVLGVHGSGKTTACHGLVAELRRMGHDVGLVREVARYCPFSLSEEQPRQSAVRTLKWLLNAQENAELEEAERYEHLVCDRTVIDRAAYAVAVLGASDATPFLQEARWWLQTQPYDSLFRTIARPEYQQADRLRSLSSEFRDSVRAAFDQLVIDLAVHPQVVQGSEVVTAMVRQVAPLLAAGSKGLTV